MASARTVGMSSPKKRFVPDGETTPWTGPRSAPSVGSDSWQAFFSPKKRGRLRSRWARSNSSVPNNCSLVSRRPGEGSPKFWARCISTRNTPLSSGTVSATSGPMSWPSPHSSGAKQQQSVHNYRYTHGAGLIKRVKAVGFSIF